MFSENPFLTYTGEADVGLPSQRTDRYPDCSGTKKFS